MRKKEGRIWKYNMGQWERHGNKNLRNVYTRKEMEINISRTNEARNTQWAIHELRSRSASRVAVAMAPL